MLIPRWEARLSAAVSIVVCGLGLVLWTSSARAADFTWSLSGFTQDTWTAGVDLDPTVLVDGSDTWVISSRGSGAGALRWKGSDIDHLTAQPDGAFDASFTRPHGDDWYWIGGVWRDPTTGKWYAAVHREYNYWVPHSYPHNQRTIGLATSTDKGANWHFEGDIITPNSSRPNPDPTHYTDFGAGDQKLVVDTSGGYFYLYYFTAWYSSLDNLVHDPYMGVARCPISSKMAPGCWQKWYRGGWTESGLGGLDSAPIPGASVTMKVHYNTYLGKWLYLDDNQMSTATDLATQNWTNVDRTWPGSYVEDYNWIVDSTGTTSSTAGQTFREYGHQVGGVGRHRTVTLGSGTTSPSNQLSNPGFESGTTGWTNAGGSNTVVTSGVHSGAQAVQQTGTGGFTQAFTNYYGGINGGTIWHVGPVALMNVSGWAKAASGSTGYIGVKYTLDGTDHYSLSPVTSTSWTYVERQVSIPTHASGVWAMVWVQNAGETATFDDIELKPATVNLVKNYSFENGFTDWGAWGANGALATDTSDNVFTGAVAATLTSFGRGQTLTGWTAGQKYFVGGWCKVGASGNIGAIGLKYVQSGGAETYQSVHCTDTSWTFQYFDVTLPANTTSVDVWAWVEPGDGTLYVDEISVTQ